MNRITQAMNAVRDMIDDHPFAMLCGAIVTGYIGNPVLGYVLGMF